MKLIILFYLFRCLGIKSPFIEFRSEFEILSNNSISLNISQDESSIKHRKGLQSLGSFINPINSNGNSVDKNFQGINNTTFSIQSDILNEKDSKKQQERQLFQLQQTQIQELQQTHKLNQSTTKKIMMDIIKPISNDINEPSTIQIIANSQIASDPGTNNYQYDESKDRKYIIPLALKTTSTLEKESIPPPVQLQSPASNIDDLKRHILMLQNFTKNDKNFQSKFVVFPKLQRNTTEAPTTTSTRPIRTTSMPFPVTMYRTKPTINQARDMHLHNSQILRDVSYPYNRNVERVTVMPQVFLQNDQTPESTPEEMEANAKEMRKKKKERKRKNNLERKERKERKNKKNQLTSTSSTTTTTTTLAPPARKSLKRNQNRKKNKEEKIPLRYDRQSTTGG